VFKKQIIKLKDKQYQTNAWVYSVNQPKKARVG
jgi:hypothetical protein